MLKSTSSKTSLKKYLIKSQIASLTFILIIFVIGLTLLSTHIFKKYSENNLKLLAASLSSQLQVAIVFDDLQNIDEILENFMQSYPIRMVEIVDNDHKMIASKHEVTQNSLPFGLFEKLQNWLISDEVGYAVIEHNGHPLATVAVFNSINPTITFIQLFTWIFLMSLFVGFIMIWLSTRLIYHKINHSLDILTKTTQIVSEQRDFNQRVPLGNIYEFNKISISFNELLNEIQTWHIHLQQENSHLEHRVLHDSLTQLPNRAYFNQRLTYLFEDEKSHRHFALLYIDNNDFKMINDNYGHLVGDAVLREMAIRLKLSLRPDDFIARIGGDEFAVLLSNISKKSLATVVAKNLLHACDAPLILENHTKIYFSFSIGIALSANAQSIEDLISQADQAMYSAKTTNKAYKFAFYDHSLE